MATCSRRDSKHNGKIEDPYINTDGSPRLFSEDRRDSNKLDSFDMILLEEKKVVHRRASFATCA